MIYPTIFLNMSIRIQKRILKLFSKFDVLVTEQRQQNKIHSHQNTTTYALKVCTSSTFQIRESSAEAPSWRNASAHDLYNVTSGAGVKMLSSWSIAHYHTHVISLVSFKKTFAKTLSSLSIDKFNNQSFFLFF